jgi:chromosomal replication initiator protein
MATTLEQYTSDLFGCTAEELFTPSRYREVVNARQVCMWVMHKYSSATLRAIGNHFNRDHATVVHSLLMVDNLCATDKQFKARVDKVNSECPWLDIPLTLSSKIYDGCKVEEDELMIL